MPVQEEGRYESKGFAKRVDEVLDLGKYKRSLMALKVTMWELQSLVSAEQGEE